LGLRFGSVDGGRTGRPEVSLGAVFSNVGTLGALLLTKMIPKLGFIYPLARRAVPQHATFTTLLMSTGLTFGTISSLYGRPQGSSTRQIVFGVATLPQQIASWWKARRGRRSKP
jgi:hypothetical protein